MTLSATERSWMKNFESNLKRPVSSNELNEISSSPRPVCIAYVLRILSRNFRPRFPFVAPHNFFTLALVDGSSVKPIRTRQLVFVAGVLRARSGKPKEWTPGHVNSYKHMQNRGFRQVAGFLLNFYGSYFFPCARTMPAREDVPCQRWQLINIYKSTVERIRANDRSAGAFAR